MLRLTMWKTKKRKGSRRKIKKQKERNREEKEKRQKILTAGVANLVERMSNESMGERFGSELISQCCQILSSNYSREGEDEADHPLMHTPEGRKDSGTPLSVIPRPPSSKPAQQFPSLSSTGYRRSPSLDRNEEADLVSERSQKNSFIVNHMTSERSIQKQFGVTQFTSILGQPRATSLRPTTGMKQPRQYPLQHISDSEDDEYLESKCSNCKKLKKKNKELKRNLEEILQNIGICI